MDWLTLSRGAPLRTARRGAERSVVPTAHELYTCHLDAVYGYVVRRVPHRQDAEDITGDVFAAALLALPKFRGGCRPVVWLIGIARRKIADSQRGVNRRRETLETDIPAELAEWAGSVSGPECAAQRAEAVAEIRRLVLALKADQQEALLLQYVDGLTIAEIGYVMKRTPAAVNGLLQRARQAVFQNGRAYFHEEQEAAQ
ncbi:RNA polymerase sigma24 factor [Capsulimonas corticalis]|uniref:RNA polymerase sigma24 factor n=1 Tax=Capsulimonas corticalis TaxID=2219043 RepID=A0A402D727_9BACT|nr:sigma-70 family RNA polymerase sigma factor [Capsulimonas corticalis]BDI29748.1 RNA polymerase sigma24 factor [Capsulimonas corticalis]